MKKVYLVSEISYDYNDEYYFRGESEGVNPKRAFDSKEEAEKLVLTLNISDFRKINPVMYSSHGEIDAISNFDSNQIAKKLSKILDKEFNEDDIWDYDGIDLSKASAEQIEEVMKVFSRLTFYEVREIEVA